MRRTIIAVSLVGVAVALTAGFLVRGRGSENTSFRLVKVERGDVVSTVNATGTLSAVRTVQVGTQVSGQIAELDADFNSHVRRGQIIARLDSTLLKQAVEQAQTDLDRARANVQQTQFLQEQAQRLFQASSMTETEYRTAVYNASVARSAEQAAEIALQRARQNLSYATIRSPIDGIVIERNVDVGQTVAASLSAPQLFLIAEDLSRLQILSSVDESDIGLIHDGQSASFTVQAYPDRVFRGTVEQVRLASTTTENVVNYTVVVTVQNPGGVLLPGMTATVNFEVAKAQDVFKVANAALRFRPTEAMVAAVRANDTLARGARGESAGGAMPDSAARAAFAARRAARGAGDQAGNGGHGAGAQASDVATLWYLDARGNPATMRVHTGITDGTATEITGPRLEAGMQVIAGILTGAQETTTNPFQQERQQGGFRRPGAF